MVHIKPVEPHQLGVVADLAKRIWPICYASILTPAQIDNMLEQIYTIENLQSEMRSGHRFFAATLNDQPAGYASAYQEGDVLWLKKLYVLPDIQGQGIGKKLVGALIGVFPSSKEIRLLVNRDNLSAQHFYTKQNFVKIDELPVKMGDFNFVDLVFSKRL